MTWVCANKNCLRYYPSAEFWIILLVPNATATRFQRMNGCLALAALAFGKRKFDDSKKWIGKACSGGNKLACSKMLEWNL